MFTGYWSSRLPFCVRAKEVAEQLKADRDDFDYRYVDIHEGITKADLEKTVKAATVPQIFVDETHVGGFTEFEAYAKEHLGLYAA